MYHVLIGTAIYRFQFYFQLMYSLKVYKGDEKIKEFIWDLISSSNDGSLRNHSGELLKKLNDLLYMYIMLM